jgi:hypothetical protein
MEYHTERDTKTTIIHCFFIALLVADERTTDDDKFGSTNPTAHIYSQEIHHQAVDYIKRYLLVSSIKQFSTVMVRLKCTRTCLVFKTRTTRRPLRESH